MEQSLYRYVWRHTRGEQIFLFLVIIVSLPFYWVSLDVPKVIVNKAIEGQAFKHGRMTATLFDWNPTLPDWLGGGVLHVSPGLHLERLPYLMVLSGWFLFLVLLNGAFKYVINVRKGILGERMLRRLRFDLFSRLMRFRPEDIASVKPAEVAGMIKDEVDPVGGFIGDAFVQPVFLLTQALTALAFIIVQSPWMGGAAAAIVGVQAVVIPYLRKEQIRLGRERQLASRRLAGRVGELVEGAPVVHGFGSVAYVEAEIGDRLGGLYTIRADLFRRKFMVKFLNNLLAQVTPFVFYALGGWAALKGSLDLGGLVAVIAAYKDLPPPINDLINWDQQRQDVTVKYEQVAAVFSPSQLLPADPPGQEGPVPAPDAPIRVSGLRVTDARGAPLLERLSLVIDRPSHVALTGEAGSGRDVLARVLGRQVLAHEGSVRVGTQDLSSLTDRQSSRFLAMASADPLLQPGSIRSNLLVPVMARVPEVDEAGAGPSLSQAERRRLREARQSGNPLATAKADWIDYERLGASGPDEVDAVLLHLLDVAGGLNDVYRLGILSRFKAGKAVSVLKGFVEARHAVRERLAALGLQRLVEPFDPTRYNTSAPVAENLLFGVPLGSRLASRTLADDPFLRSVVEQEGLGPQIVEIGFAMAEMAVSTFAGLPPDHPVFDRYSSIPPERIDHFAGIVESAGMRGGTAGLPGAARTELFAIGLDYVEPRHQLGLIDEGFQARVVHARASFRERLPAEYRPAIEFYDPDRFILAAPLSDNMLFGRIAYGYANAVSKVYAASRAVLTERGLDRTVYRLGLEFDVGIGGRLLQAHQRARLSLARALVGRPDMLVLENALGALAPGDAQATLTRLRGEMAGRTLIAALPDEEASGFERTIRFEGPRVGSDSGQEGGQEAGQGAGQGAARPEGATQEEAAPAAGVGPARADLSEQSGQETVVSDRVSA